MRYRHRIPTIFSIYMVDILCCALGCVILLWQFYNLESEEQRTAAQDALAKLQSAQFSIASLSGEITNLKESLDATEKNVVRVTLELETTRGERDQAVELALVRKREYDDLKKAFAGAEALLASLREQEKDLKSKGARTAAELAAEIKARGELAERLSALEKQLALKEGDARAAGDRLDKQALSLKEAEARANQLEERLAALKVQDTQQKLKLAQADTRARGLEEQLAELRRLETTLQARLTQADSRELRLEEQIGKMIVADKDQQTKLALADARGRLLDEELTKSRQDLTEVRGRVQELMTSQDALGKRYDLSLKELSDARGNVNALEGQVQAARTAADKRFAGLTLSGARVVFLVDMSGSMELIDEAIADPDKWPEVCETLGRIMQSLAGLKQYQVILFSAKVRYPLGQQGRWLDYDPARSVKATVEALKAIRPEGETDMSSAFEEAFRYRDKGLDTIYVLSDGLPNAGAGLPADSSKLTERQKNDLLAQHIRQRLKNVWNRPVNGQRVRIQTVGFFFESPDVGAFLWALARENDGGFVGMSRP